MAGQAGEPIGAHALADPSIGAVVRVRGGVVTVTEGPYPRTLDQVAGHYAVDRAAQVDRDTADLDQDEADRRGDGEPGRDPGQRRQDQTGRAEDFQDSDQADERHGNGVGPAHHRLEPLLALGDLLASGVEVEGGQECRDDPLGNFPSRGPAGGWCVRRPESTVPALPMGCGPGIVGGRRGKAGWSPFT